MRFLKQQTINRRQLRATTVYSDVTDSNVYINPRNSGSMVLPSGTDAQTPASPVNGMMRYNVDHSEVQVYQSGQWRSLRFKESSGITQQSLGYGDSQTTVFGPLNPAPPSVVQSGASWSGSNLIVVVENVIQLFNTNYVVTQNPIISSVVYTPKVTGIQASGATTLYFDTSVVPPYLVYPSVSIVGAVVTGSTSLQASTEILSYTVNIDGQLSSITIDKATTDVIPDLTELTITEAQQNGLGYYLEFSSAVPVGKPVTVLHGFDK